MNVVVVENAGLKNVATTESAGTAVPLDLSVVVPAFKDRGHLGDVLRALANQQPPVKEIIVSHSGVGDPQHYLPTGFVPIRVLHNDEQRFSGAARNAGCAVASGSWLAFVDDDVIPAPDWSARLARVLADETLDTCFVGSVDAGVSGGYWGMCLWFVEFGSVHGYMPNRPIEGGASANMFLPRSLYEAAGGFPEDVERCVDVEFMARCRQSGGHTRFVRDVIVSHRNIGGLMHCLGHARSLGCGSARIRHLAKLSGSVFVKQPLIIPLLVPLRLVQIGYRVGRWGEGFRLPFLWYLPGILLALSAWSVGFFRFTRETRREARAVEVT